ncbi:MAG: hypothetical protein ACKVJ7_07700 [Candidatus Poseidoniales archaeon]|jgi:hypothetical protein
MLTILVAALFAGIVAVLVTVAVEKWGGIVGGILGTLPTTIVPATIGMYVEGGSTDLATSMSLIPFWMLLNALFVGAWVAYPRMKKDVGIKQMASVSLIFWIISALAMTIVLSIALDHFSKLLIGITGLFFLIVLGLWMTFNPRNAPKGKNKVSKEVLLVRGLAAATAIGIAVQLSSMGQPIIAGLASVFPAIFLTTMVALWLAQGPEVPTGAAGPMMLGGSSVAVYSLLAPWALPEYGILFGTLICWFGSVISTSIPAYSWITWRNKINPVATE